jgi:hypothetical protein
VEAVFGTKREKFSPAGKSRSGGPPEAVSCSSSARKIALKIQEPLDGVNVIGVFDGWRLASHRP